MRLVPLLLVAAAAAPARAEFVMCVNGQGLSPPENTMIPPHARLVYHTDFALTGFDKVTAKIDGKPVRVKRLERRAMPFKFIVYEIDSDRTGQLVVDFDGRSPAKWTVKAMELPKEVTGITARYRAPAHRGEAGENFDGLVIKLAEGTPAVLGMAKIRKDATYPWQEIQSAIYTPPSESRPQIRLGDFDCAANALLGELAKGFDLEARVMLVDGTERVVTGFAPHLTLPAPLPPQPRPKNQRP